MMAFPPNDREGHFNYHTTAPNYHDGSGEDDVDAHEPRFVAVSTNIVSALVLLAQCSSPIRYLNTRRCGSNRSHHCPKV